MSDKQVDQIEQEVEEMVQKAVDKVVKDFFEDMPAQIAKKIFDEIKSQNVESDG